MTTLRTSSLRRITMVALAVFAACAPVDDDGTLGTDIQGLTGAARRPRLQRIRDVAATAGLTNGVLLAGIAQVETGLSHCWSEATWACRGPNSSSCGDGPVIAGASDGPCSAQQGGLGMFQFDGGNFTQTLARDGRGILTLDGNITHAVDFVVNIVNQEVSGVDNRTEALAWMNGITVARGDARFERWVAILACRYNGACGSAAQAGRYRDATLSAQSEVGAAFWRICTPSREVCNGMDDDCDGRVDDSIAAVNCGVGACRRTVSCTAGRMAACAPGASRAEVCGNGADDDCDGTTDEDCARDAGAPLPRDAGPVVVRDAAPPAADATTRDAGAVDAPGWDGGWDGGSVGEDAAARDDARASEDGGAGDDAQVLDDAGVPPTEEPLPSEVTDCDVGARAPGDGGRAVVTLLALAGIASRRRRAGSKLRLRLGGAPS